MNPSVEDYSGRTDEEVWAEWKAKFQRNYKSLEEEQFRFNIFKESKAKVQEHNEKYLRGETSFTMGLNQFSDKESHEICRGGLKPRPNANQ